MQNLQPQNSQSKAEISNPQLSYLKQVELWTGRLAMVSFMKTVAVMVLYADY